MLSCCWHLKSREIKGRYFSTDQIGPTDSMVPLAESVVLSEAGFRAFSANQSPHWALKVLRKVVYIGQTGTDNGDRQQQCCDF